MDDSEVRKEFREIWKQFDAISKIVNDNKSDGTDKRVASNTELANRASKLEKDVEVIGERQTNVRERLKVLEEHYDDLSKTYVTKGEYAMVKYIVHTIVALFVVGIVTSLIRLILPHADFTQ